MLEFRRRRALALLDEGRSLNEVARLLGCAPSSVMRWRDRRRRGGIKALKVGASPGRPPKLTAVQRRRLIRLLLRGAMAHGYTTEVWTTGRIAEVIEEHFGVTYHRDHVGRLLHGLGWSDESAIKHWKQKRWPRVKKTLQGWAPTSSSSTNRGSS
jgi:putative transposase